MTGPAGRATLSGTRCELKPDLVSQLLSDCSFGADTLPLLGLTLARLYRNYGADGDLRLDEYQNMGGMADVIRSEAESTLSGDLESRASQLEALHAAFIPWLATINPENNEPMRRLARMSDLVAGRSVDVVHSGRFPQEEILGRQSRTRAEAKRQEPEGVD